MDEQIEMWHASFPLLGKAMDARFGDGDWCEWADVSLEEMSLLCTEEEKESLLGPINEDGEQLLVDLSMVATAYDFRREWQKLVDVTQAQQEPTHG